MKVMTSEPSARRSTRAPWGASRARIPSRSPSGAPLGDGVVLCARGRQQDADELLRLHGADALHAAEVGGAPCEQTGKVAAGGEEQILGDAFHVPAGAAATQDHGELLGIGEGLGAGALLAFLRTLADGEVLDAGHRVEGGGGGHGGADER